MHRSDSNADAMFPGDTSYDDYVVDERDHIGADQVVQCSECAAVLDADYDVFFEAIDGAIVCISCWIGVAAEAVSA